MDDELNKLIVEMQDGRAADETPSFPVKPLKIPPKYGVYLWWPVAEDWVHRDDLDTANELIPSDRVFRREEYDDQYGDNHIGWIVDPIDGTINFLYNLPVVAVSIAATVDDRVVAGAVADVHRRETYSATSGMGARRDGVDVHASDATDLGQAR